MKDLLRHMYLNTLISMEEDLSDAAWRQCGPDADPGVDLADVAEWRTAIKAEIAGRKGD